MRPADLSGLSVCVVKRAVTEPVCSAVHSVPKGYTLQAAHTCARLCRATGEHASSDEMLERCLYALDLAFHPRFVLGRSRMSHGPVRNRPLFAALFKQMQVGWA